MASKSTINVRILGDSKGLNKALSDSESRVGRWSKSVGKVAAAGAAAAGAAAVGAGVALFKIGEGFDEQLDKIRVGTGATGDALAGLSDSFQNVLRANNRATFDTAGSAIADLNTRLGLTGSDLENLSGQFINLADITGTDLAGNVDKLTRVFGDWEISTAGQAESLDQVYRAAQASGIGIDELSGSVVQFGAPLRNLGFGFEESLALLSQFNKTGVNTETVFAGLKAGVGKLAKEGEPVPETFSRIVEEITALGPGSEATGLAIELFGQRAGPDLADAIAGGKFEIEDMLAAITDGTDTINDAAADTESFGEKWNGIKNRVLVGLQPLAEQVFDGIGKAMDRLGPVIERFAAWLSVNIPIAAAAVQAWFEENWPKIRAVMEAVFSWLTETAWPVVRTVLGALVAAGQAVTDWFRENWPAIRDVIGAVFDWLTETAWPAVRQVLDFVVEQFGVVVDWVRENWPAIRETIETVVNAVRTVIETQLAIIRKLWDVFGDTILNAAEYVWNTIKNVVETAINSVLSIIEIVMGIITGDWSAAWEGIKSLVGGIWDGIKAQVSAAINAIWTELSRILGGIDRMFGNIWDGIATKIDDTWESIKSGVAGGIDAVIDFVAAIPGRVAGAIGSGFRAIWDNAKLWINKLIRSWNGLSFTFPSFSGDWNGPLPGGNFTVGGWQLNTPNIPTLATGGVLSSPTLAMVGEYAGARTDPEIVSPRSMMMDSFRDVLAENGSGPALQVMGDMHLHNDVEVETVTRRLNLAMGS